MSNAGTGGQMVTPPDETTIDPYAVIAALRAERDAAQRALAERTAELAHRNSAYDERIEYQSATIDVLKAMSASPGDPQPVFDLITQRAQKLCNSNAAGIFEYDGSLVYARSFAGNPDPVAFARYLNAFPMVPDRGSISCRAILELQVIHVRDGGADPELWPIIRDLNVKSQLSIPLLRDGVAIGVFSLSSPEPGGYSDSQVALFHAFAEQAVIAITSAETYRALQSRTSDLQESLEYQTAISGVLNVISRSAFALQPVLDTVAETAARLCGADTATITIREGDIFRSVSNSTSASEPEYWAILRQRRIAIDRDSLTGRVALEGGVVQIADNLADPDFAIPEAVASRRRTMLGVPLLREGVVLGTINLTRKRVEPFTKRQIELVCTFADQAVIAIENTRLITEQREALEHQTATADVLRVINASPGALVPVFTAILETAHRLCGSTLGSLLTFDGTYFTRLASHGYPTHMAEALRQPYPPQPRHEALLRGERFVQIMDLREFGIGPNEPISRDVIDALGLRTGLYVPLRKDGRLVGLISAYRREVRQFSERHIALLESFAAQAVIAMENARLINETREALERQTATAEVLQVINANPGNLTPVFDAILEKAHSLIGAVIGALVLYEDPQFRAVATHGFSEQHDTLVRQLHGPSPGHLELLDGRRFKHYHDLQSIENEQHDAVTRRHVENNNARTALWVPLRKDDRLLGLISVYRLEVRPFLEKEIALLENFASQAVIAMENARLLTEQREALQQQTATAEVLQAINASPGNLAPVFDEMLAKAMRLCGAAFGSFYTYDGERLHSAAQRGVPPAYADYRAHNPTPIRQGTGIAHAIATRSPHRVLDVMTTEAFATGEPAVRAMVELGGVRTLLSVPLCKEQTVVGLITIYRQEVREFSPKQVALLENFAAQAVIAMENARLLTELQQRTEELARRNSEYGERIEQQSATIDVLAAMSASSGDAQPVFQVIVERARAFCNADNANLALVDGDMLHVQATTINNSSENAVYMAQFPRPVDATSMFGRAILARGAVQTPDVSADPQHFQRTMSGGAIPRPRGFVAVPLQRAGAPIGAIVLARNTPGEFSATQVELLRTFAEQAVIAISSAETFKELQRRTADLTRSVAELQALEEVLRAVNSSLELETVLSTIISRAVQLSDADEGTIYEYDVSEQVFVPKSAFGMSEGRVAALRERRIRLGETHLGRSAVLRAPVYVEDVQQDPSVPNAGDVLPGIHAVLAVPLLRNDTVIGGLVVRRRAEKGFAETIITLMQTFSSQAVLAIENARLFREAGRARTAAEVALVDLRRAQDRLVQSEKMASLGQLTAGIAHEIKNPLNFVNNFADLSAELLDELHGAVAGNRQAEIDELTVILQGNLAKITEHGRRADAIVRSMLEHSRGSSGERRSVDLNALVDEALNLAYHGARAQDQSFNVELQRDFAGDISPVTLVPQDVTRVLLNLFSNGFHAARRRQSREATPGFEPTISVATRELGDAVEFRVRDNGIGIPEEVRDKLFQPFFTTKPAGEGTGLGLSISYDIVTQQHGGTISVESEVGAYTEFTVTIPRA